MTLHNTGGPSGPARSVSPVPSRRSRQGRQGLSICGVIAAIALSFYLLNGGVATSQNSGGTPDASPVASPQADDPRITIEFTELNDSGVTGTATLFASGATTVVELDLDGTGEDHPAHIHEGTCEDIQPEPAYNLENVGEEGTSTSVVDVPLDELIDGDYVIDLHLAANQLGTLIVCADIEGEPTDASGTPVAVGGQGDPTAAATATEAVTPEPTATLAPTVAPTIAPADTPVPTIAPADTPVPTATLAPTHEATTAPESTPDNSTDNIGGLISGITADGGDGTQGSSPMLDSGKGGPVTSTSGKGGSTTGTGDGTQGGSSTQSGKGGNNGAITTTAATGQLSSTGTGSSLILPQTPYEAVITAMGAFSVILFAAGLMLRQGEVRYATSRWRRLGL